VPEELILTTSRQKPPADADFCLRTTPPGQNPSEAGCGWRNPDGNRQKPAAADATRTESGRSRLRTMPPGQKPVVADTKFAGFGWKWPDLAFSPRFPPRKKDCVPFPAGCILRANEGDLRTAETIDQE